MQNKIPLEPRYRRPSIEPVHPEIPLTQTTETREPLEQQLRRGLLQLTRFLVLQLVRLRGMIRPGVSFAVLLHICSQCLAGPPWCGHCRSSRKLDGGAALPDGPKVLFVG